VHHHLQASGEKITEMTPAAIYEIFIDLCRARLHLVIACTNAQQFSYSEIFRRHTSILSGAVQINFRVIGNNFIVRFNLYAYINNTVNFISFCVFYFKSTPFLEMARRCIEEISRLRF